MRIGQGLKNSFDRLPTWLCLLLAGAFLLVALIFKAWVVSDGSWTQDTTIALGVSLGIYFIVGVVAFLTRSKDDSGAEDTAEQVPRSAGRT